MLKDKLTGDMKSAMKEGRAFELGILRMLLAAVHNKEIEKGAQKEGLADADILAVLRAEAKKRRDAIELYGKGGREDLKKKEEGELAVIEGYLPVAASQEEIEKAVDAALRLMEAPTLKDMGKIISVAMKQLQGRAEGSSVSEMVKKRLHS